MVYARDTNVSVNRTREQIVATLQRYGADAFGYGSDGEAGYELVYFRMNDRRVRLLVQLPGLEEFVRTGTGRRRSPGSQRSAHEQACRQRWRAMLLLITANLEGVASGITTLGEEFLAHIYLPDGRTVGEFIRPQIEESYRTGRISLMLPQGRDE